jgi:alpha-tubulin suppressor-like RCC1 family protein
VEPGQVCRPSFEKVAAGTGFACGLDEDDALWCWGSNLHHQIDPGDALQFPLATRIAGRTWEAIDAGGEHVCGISAGELYCWGRNHHFQVAPISGDVADPHRISVPDGPASWSAVSAGEQSTCAIGDGTLYCWGSNRNGALGVNSFDPDFTEPTPVSTMLADWTAVDIGSDHACAVSAGSGVYCWGNAYNGRGGPNASGPQLTPALALATPATSVAVSDNVSCATTAAGELLCWGANYEGELGPSNTALGESAMPVVASTVTGWTSVAAGLDKLCGLAGDTVYCWGRANQGGLGNGLWTDTKRFGKVLAGARAVSVGWNRDNEAPAPSYDRELELACALVGGDVQCWGDNRYGQLGRGDATMALVPGEVDGDHRWTQISLGHSHGCGIEDGALFCWGATTSGQTIGMTTGSSSPRTPCMANLDCDVGKPKQIGFIEDAASVATGAAHTCALHNDLITCWGDNGSTQLGTNPAGPFRRDVPQPGGRPWKSLLPTGRNGQCASPGFPEVWCWGSVLTQHGPMRETALDDIRAIGVGEGMVCALDAAGSLKCAGGNDRGQYGNGRMGSGGTCGDAACNNGETAASCSGDCGTAPLAQLARTYDALAVSSSRAFACGSRGGGIECWGANPRGQTGAVDPGTTTLTDPTYTPNPVAGLSGCTAVTAGEQHACAICGGAIHCWGDGSAGTLGTGVLTRDPSPTPQKIDLILDADPWVDLASGLRFSCARSQAGRAFCWGSDAHAGLGNGATAANLPVTVLASPTR